MGEKLCLKWNDFQEHLLSSFGELRSDYDFTDVTLACEDQSVKAHKVILSACSPFFKKLLKTHSHHQPLIYMRGVKAYELVAMMDFVYQGEANILQDHLESFLALAEELELKGFSGRTEEKAPEMSKYSPVTQKMSTNQNPRPNNPMRERSSSTNLLANVKRESENNEGKVATFQANPKPTAYIDTNTMEKIESLMERVTGGGFSCNNCGYTSKQKGHMQEHVEKHIEGLEYPCNSCNKIMRSSLSLRNHKRKTMACFTMTKMLKAI